MKKSILYLLTPILLLVLNKGLHAQSQFSVSKKSTGDTLLIIKEDGKVGIGTTNPTDLLDVRGGDEATSGTFKISNSDGSNFFYAGSGNSAYQAAQFIWQESNPLIFSTYGTVSENYAEWMRIGSNGFVGIGKEDPQVRLDIGLTDPWEWQRGIRVLNPDMGTGHRVMLVLGRSDDTKNMGHMNFWYDAEQSDLNRLSFGLYGVNDILNINGLGNVGIGITDPDSRLQVAGEIHSTSDGFRFPDGTVQTTAAGAGMANTLDQAYDQGGAGAGRTITADNGAVQIDGSDGLIVNGRVGIGTVAPASGLHLKGTGFPNSFLYLEGANDNDAGVRFYEGDTAKWHFFNNAGLNGLQIYNTGGAKTVFFADQTTGNVGIGTTSPSTRLEVADTIFSSIGGYKFPDGSVQTSASSGSGVWAGSPDIYYLSGNVGIGDDSPDFQLEISDKFGIRDSQIVYLPDQDEFEGTIYFGNGGHNLGGLPYYENWGGNFNTVLGFGALYNNIDGYKNTAIGYNALYTNEGQYQGTYNGEGNDNTAIGYNALYSSYGARNTAIGSEALRDNIAGNDNTAIGYQALQAMGKQSFTTYSGNTAVGSQIMTLLENGDGNTVVGYMNLWQTDNSSDNTIIGSEAARDLTGDGNTIIGQRAARIMTGGEYNTILGNEAGYGLENGSGNVIIGNGAAVGLGTDLHNKLIINNVPYNTPLIEGDFETNQLNVHGDLNVDDTISVFYLRFGDGTVQHTAPEGGGDGVNTLDEAYDTPNPGDGRVIVADAGPLEVQGIDGVIFRPGAGGGSGVLPVWNSGEEIFLWYPNQAALRVGTPDRMNPIGKYSVAMGFSSAAVNDHAMAFGNNNLASGISSFAFGERISVFGDNSFGISLSDFLFEETPRIYQDSTLAIIGGPVGIGTVAPTAKLEVKGTIHSTEGGIKFPDGTVQLSAAPASGDDGIALIGTHGTGSIAASGVGTRLLWYPAKSAFRVGYVNGTQWNEGYIGEYSVATGYGTVASNSYSTAMGASSTASGFAATAIGRSADATGTSSVAIGDYTEANGSGSTSLGRSTTADANYSTALGSYVTSSGTGSFTIGDNSTSTVMTNAADDRFMSRFAGGYYLYTNSTHTIGAALTANSSSWAVTSDSTKKENFQPVAGEEILAKLGGFKLGTWNYIGQDPTKFRHYGPMAQDFYAAFGHDGIGSIGCDTLLSSADFDGINFIAIQALEKRTRDNKKAVAEIESLRSEVTSLMMENLELKDKIATMEKEVKEFKSLVVEYVRKNESKVEKTEVRY